MKNMSRCTDDFGWSGVDALRSLDIRFRDADVDEFCLEACVNGDD